MIQNISIKENSLLNSTLTTNTLQNLSQKKEIEQKPIRKREQKPTKKLVSCFTCPVQDCSILFQSETELLSHKKEHEILYSCPFNECNKTFICFNNLRKHYNTHLSIHKEFFCPFPGCNKSFTRNFNLNIHYRIHTGNKVYFCEKCGKGFYYRSNYNYHLTVKHKEIKENERTCLHQGCNKKSKTSKFKSIHHDKLEPECKKEKSNLLKLIILFKVSVNKLLSFGENKISIYNDLNINERELGNEIRKVQSIYKEDFEIIKRHYKYLLGACMNRDQYQAILGNQ